MDYEKAYKAVLQTAKQWIKDGCADKEKICLECVFPELRESEDERIRRTLVEYFGPKVQLDFVRGVPIQKIRDWLEKQKEQKELPLMGGDTDSYFDDLRMTTKPLTSREWFDEGMKYAQRLQKEQKPLETPSPSVIYTEQGDVLAEQKPAWSEDIIRKAVKEIGLTQHQIDWFKTNVFPPKQEWSEEDADILNCCISSIEEAKENRYAYKETDGDTSYDREIAWLKSLRPQPREEIYQSAKHDLAIKFMNYLDENRPEGKMSLSNGECEDIDKAFKENDWAKIMRYVEKYRPSWKPSEEQMGALSWMLENARGNIDFDPLKDLYEQLKKL